jgi:hypothetical protein
MFLTNEPQRILEVLLWQVTGVRSFVQEGNANLPTWMYLSQSPNAQDVNIHFEVLGHTLDA